MIPSVLLQDLLVSTQWGRSGTPDRGRRHLRPGLVISPIDNPLVIFFWILHSLIYHASSIFFFLVENMIWRDHNFKHGLFSATEVKKIREKYLPRRKLRFSHFPFCHPPPYLIVASWVSPSDLHLLCPSAQPDWPVLQSSSPPLSSSLGHSLL